jgi:hypothetical protein
MANTITNKTVYAGANRVIKYITLVSDGSQETNTVLYDSSVIATAVGLADPLTSNIESVYASVSAASTARIKLNWDATTPVLALDIPPVTSIVKADFRRHIPIGGLPNQGGTGITGDITLTTTGLASGDLMTLVLEIKRA